MERIPVTTIDQIREDLKLQRVDFIKVDVEGAAERALRGSSKTLAKFGPRLAVSTEEETDDPIGISRLVNTSRPGYRRVCGQCGIRDGVVDPGVLFFY